MIGSAGPTAVPEPPSHSRGKQPFAVWESGSPSPDGPPPWVTPAGRTHLCQRQVAQSHYCVRVQEL